MKESCPYLESVTPVSRERFDREEVAVIDAAGLQYRRLNEQIFQLAEAGERRILIRGVRGQRYIGARLNYPDLNLKIEGVPGEDLGFNLSGPTLEVFGPVQNAAANTMDSGMIIVHGLGGDALAYGMRGGKLFVRDDVGYRVGIHMKQYRDKVPVLIIGGTSGDYLGEYMAGGIIILLNKNGAREAVAGSADRTLATGIHGGELYIYDYDLPAYLPGIGALVAEATGEDRKKIEPFVREFCRCFDLNANLLLDRSLTKVTPESSRPFARFYYPAYPADTGLKPVHTERTPPCEAACPAGVPTGRFLKQLRLGEVEKALELIDQVTPLRYSCCGFICPHLCMQSCTRGRVDFAVRTAELARRYKSGRAPQPKGTYPEKIAVIGAGPAGLSAAYQLALKGYQVTVYDEADKPGGKLYQVISRARLPLEDLEHDLKRIEKLGVHFHLYTKIDAASFQEILDQYDYVVVSVGAQQPVMPPIKGAEKLRAGIEFLKEYNQSGLTLIKERKVPGTEVVFIGGGDAAVDGIEAALDLRVNPSNITVVDVKKPSANPLERKKLEEQGVRFRYPLFLEEVTAQGVVVKHPEGKKELIPADTVLVFINEKPALAFLPQELLDEKDSRGFFTADSGDHFRTINPKVSIVGDSRGLGLVTTNIGRGRRCAAEIDALLRGHEYLPQEAAPQERVHLHPERAVPVLEAEAELEEECSRCLHCGICVQCDACVKACPRQALTREGETFSVDLSQCGGCGTCAATCPGGVIRMEARA